MTRLLKASSLPWMLSALLKGCDIDTAPKAAPTSPTPSEARCPYPYPESCGNTLSRFPPYLLGAVYGLGAGGGVGTGFNNISAAIKAGCNVQDTSDGTQGTSCVTEAQIRLMCASPVSSAKGLNPPSFPLDLVPVHFSWPVWRNRFKGTFPSLDWSDFEFVRTDGTTVQPWCVTMLPQNDGNEGFTVLTMTPGLEAVSSPTGESQGPPAVKKVKIVGSLILTNGTIEHDVQGAEFEGGNLNYSTGGVLVQAYARDYKRHLNYNYAREGNDPCPAYPETTHVVTASGIGGLSRDGVNAFLPNQFEIFEIRMTDGTYLPKDRFVQIADLDGDDLTDICLRLAEGEFETLASLNMQCDMNDPELRFSLPKGMEGGRHSCSASQPQTITHVQCPESALCR